MLVYVCVEHHTLDLDIRPVFRPSSGNNVLLPFANFVKDQPNLTLVVFLSNFAALCAVLCCLGERGEFLRSLAVRKRNLFVQVCSGSLQRRKFRAVL